MLSALPSAPRDGSVAERDPGRSRRCVPRSLGGRRARNADNLQCAVSEESAGCKDGCGDAGPKARDRASRLVSVGASDARSSGWIDAVVADVRSCRRTGLAGTIVGRSALVAVRGVGHPSLVAIRGASASERSADLSSRTAQLAARRSPPHDRAVDSTGRPIGLPVAPRLVAPRAARVDPAQYQRLLERTERTLTQGHLAQHVFFHYLHQAETKAHAWEIFGVSPSQFQRLRAAGFTPAEIGALRQRSRAFIADAITRVCRLSAAAGVRRGDTSARQAARFLSRQRRGVDAYLDQALHAQRRQRLHLPPTVRRSVPTGRALRAFLRAERRAASVLPVASRLNAVPPSNVPTAVSSGFTVWPSAGLLIPPS